MKPFAYKDHALQMMSETEAAWRSDKTAMESGAQNRVSKL